jgi:hypothetical protein
MAEEKNVPIDGTENNGGNDPVPTVDELREQIARLQGELATAKSNLSKANGEAAENKRKLREHQTAEEAAEAERAQKEAEREARIAELEKIVNVSNFKARYLALGMEEKLANETAEAFANGENDKVFDNLAKFNAEQRKAWEAEHINKQPGLPSGEPENKPISKEQFADMDYNARAKLYSENKEMYDNLIGGNS